MINLKKKKKKNIGEILNNFRKITNCERVEKCEE